MLLKILLNNTAPCPVESTITLGILQSSSSMVLSTIRQFDLLGIVTPHLPQASDYHILLPDLLGHGVASAIKPFSVTLAAHLISELITRRAHNGVVTLVGLSLGADVAPHVASDFPSVVDKNCAFVSGASTPGLRE